MKPQQIRVRKFRGRRPSGSRSTDGIRQVYYNPAIRAAKGAVRIPADQAGEQEQEN